MANWTTIKYRGNRGRVAFTLIELLVVISIIGVLVAITLGVTGLASRKMREKRMEAELHKLAFEIENYHSKRHQYPPDHPGQPSTNQLYYELSGTVYTNLTFDPIGGQPGGAMTTAMIQNQFGSDGFANSSRNPNDPELFHAAFKNDQVKDFPGVTASGAKIKYLAAPLPSVYLDRPPNLWGPSNAWNYVSTKPTNNTESFDLWVDVKVGDHIYRFCNWSSQPTLIQ